MHSSVKTTPPTPTDEPENQRLIEDRVEQTEGGHWFPTTTFWRKTLWRRKVERFEKDSPSMLSSLQMTLAPHQLLLQTYGWWFSSSLLPHNFACLPTPPEHWNGSKFPSSFWKFLSNWYLCRAVWLNFHKRSSLRQGDPMHLVKQFDTLIERGYQSWIY